MKKNYRAGRLGEEIKKIISDLLLKEIKDPRLEGKLVSITAVKVSSDGSHATVYFTYLSIGEDAAANVSSGENKENMQEMAEVSEALNSCKSFIRKEIGKNVKLRHTPELVFKHDTSSEYGMHIEELISTISKSEE